jgi:hypothetical protein
VQPISADWLFISFLCDAYVRCGDEGSAIPLRSSALVWWTLATGGTAGCSPQETDFNLADVYSADGAFVTGTFAGIIPVVAVDGRQIGDGTLGRSRRISRSGTAC